MTFEHLKSDAVAPRIKRKKKKVKKKKLGQFSILEYKSFFTVVRDYLNNAQWTCAEPSKNICK